MRNRCCCNCRHDIRTWDGGNCITHCEIDGHYIGYVECFEGWCRRWAKDKWQDERSESKTYKTPDGRAAVFYYDRNGVGKITLESMNMLMGELVAYQQCIQSRSFWDSKHCDGCRFYDNCPFNPQEDEDESQTEAEGE